MVGVLVESLTGQDVFQDDQQAKILPRVVAEELRNPAQRFRSFRMRGLERPKFADVILGTMTWIIEWKIDHQLPRVVTVLQGRIRQLANVLEQHDARAIGVFPKELVVLLKLILAGDPQLLEQHLPHATDAVALIVLTPGLLDDAFGIHARELDRDRRIALFTDADFARRRRPVADAAQHLTAFGAGHGNLDRAVIEGRQLFGI